MDIRSALDRIVVVQGGLAITDPITASVQKAWKYVPSRRATLADTPAFTNSWRLVSTESGNSLFRRQYTVNMQLFVNDADTDRAADIASSFEQALHVAFNADKRLENTVTRQTIYGGDPTLALLEYAKKTYVGLDLFMDIWMNDDVTFAA